MKILVVGSRGNMGSKYLSILKFLGMEALEYDLGLDMPNKDSYDRVIIATPTENHYIDCIKTLRAGKSFLCEKPIASPPKIQNIIDGCTHFSVDGRMVCNWAFTFEGMQANPGRHTIAYDCYNTGKDGLAWDCIQLIYMAKGFPFLKKESPFLNCKIDGMKIDEAAIARSYVDMIDAWLRDPTQLWSLEDAKKATEKTIQYMEIHK